MIDLNKPTILYVITNKLNNWKYYGIIHKKGKTIQERFEDHIKNKRGGRFLHREIVNFGHHNFIIEEVERGTFEYISKREIEESKNCLWVKQKGYNGCSGKCILLDEEMQKRKFENTNQIARVKKWKETYDSRKHLHNYKRSKDFLEKQESVNYSKIRGKTKETSERLKKLSKSMKYRSANPTPEMVEGRKKCSITMKSQNKNNCIRIKKFIETLYKNPKTGKKAPNFKAYWITPRGKFETSKDAAQNLNIGISTLEAWCNKNKTIHKKYYHNNSMILNEWDNKSSFNVGFKREK